MTAPDREQVLALMRRLQEGPLGARLILGGSSGVYGVSEEIPAFTEDVGVLVDADWIAGEEELLVAEMRKLGFDHQPGTPTFTSQDGLSLDLVGFSRADDADRIGGGRRVPVMVYGDLGRVLSLPGSTRRIESGAIVLSPAALAVAKLLTIRLEKGGKDKLQALLVIAENADDPEFAADLPRMLGAFPADRIEDAIGDAQAAVLAVTTDVAVAGPQAAGYAGMQQRLELGFAALLRLVPSGRSGR